MCNPVEQGYSDYGRECSAGTPSPSMLIDSDALAEKVGQYMLSVPQSLAWWTGGRYDGHSLTRKGPRWFLVVRMTLDRIPVVAFTEGDTIGEVFQQFAIGIAHGLVVWRADRYR